MARVGWQDFRASLVVVIVAIPFCSVVSAACGVGFERGLLTAVIGGLVVGPLVGTFGGARLQISGPAVSMGAVLLGLVAQHGVAALGPAVFLTGAFQVLGAGLRLGGIGGMLPRAVVAGAVCAAGLIQAAAQAHGAVGAAAHPDFIANLFDLPAVLAAARGGPLLVAAVTIGVAAFWHRLAPGALRHVPATVAAAAAGCLAAAAWPEGSVHLRAVGSLAMPSAGRFAAMLADPAIWTVGALLAAMGTAESLASAEATALTCAAAGRLRRNRELFAQGIGNMVCGVAGALPLAGAIPRSAANARAGATGPASNVLHAVMIGLVLVAAPGLLAWVPVPAVAALLVLGGWRLAFERSALTVGVEGAVALTLFIVTLATALGVNVPAGIAAGGACGVLAEGGRRAACLVKDAHGKVLAGASA